METRNKKRIKNPWLGLEGYNCFGCAPHNPNGLHLEFYDEGDEVSARFIPSGHPDKQGWIGTLHGGIQATMMDETCAWAIFRFMQVAAVTSKLEVKYIKPVLCSYEYLELRARIKEQKRSFVTVEGSICSPAGDLLTQALVTYYVFSKEQSETEMHFSGCKLEGEE